MSKNHTSYEIQQNNQRQKPRRISDEISQFVYDSQYQRHLGPRTGLLFDVVKNKDKKHYDGYRRFSDYRTYGQITPSDQLNPSQQNLTRNSIILDNKLLENKNKQERRSLGSNQNKNFQHQKKELQQGLKTNTQDNKNNKNGKSINLKQQYDKNKEWSPAQQQRNKLINENNNNNKPFQIDFSTIKKNDDSSQFVPVSSRRSSIRQYRYLIDMIGHIQEKKQNQQNDISISNKDKNDQQYYKNGNNYNIPVSPIKSSNQFRQKQQNNQNISPNNKTKFYRKSPIKNNALDIQPPQNNRNNDQNFKQKRKSMMSFGVQSFQYVDDLNEEQFYQKNPQLKINNQPIQNRRQSLNQKGNILKNKNWGKQSENGDKPINNRKSVRFSQVKQTKNVLTDSLGQQEVVLKDSSFNIFENLPFLKDDDEEQELLIDKKIQEEQSKKRQRQKETKKQKQKIIEQQKRQKKKQEKQEKQKKNELKKQQQKQQVIKQQKLKQSKKLNVDPQENQNQYYSNKNQDKNNDINDYLPTQQQNIVIQQHIKEQKKKKGRKPKKQSKKQRVSPPKKTDRQNNTKKNFQKQQLRKRNETNSFKSIPQKLQYQQNIIETKNKTDNKALKNKESVRVIKNSKKIKKQQQQEIAPTSSNGIYDFIPFQVNQSNQEQNEANQNKRYPKRTKTVKTKYWKEKIKYKNNKAFGLCLKKTILNQINCQYTGNQVLQHDITKDDLDHLIGYVKIPAKSSIEGKLNMRQYQNGYVSYRFSVQKMHFVSVHNGITEFQLKDQPEILPDQNFKITNHYQKPITVKFKLNKMIQEETDKQQQQKLDYQ